MHGQQLSTDRPFMKPAFSLFIFLCFIFTSAQETKKNLVTKRVSNPPKIDGVLDDDAWQNADIAKDFVMFQPAAGDPEPKNQRTEVRVVYDDEAIYFGAYLYDDQVVPKQIANRDNFGIVDWFEASINPNNDSQNDTDFLVQTSGNQLDAKSSPDGRDFSWSAVWDSEVTVVEDGWIVEMKIPYSALRFSNQEVQTWGINFRRRFANTRNQYTWNLIDPTKGRKQQYAGTLTGINNIKPPTRLSFSPYASAEYNSFDGENTFSKSIGLDVKYGISESFTLDATLIPDFGQTAFDEIELNLGPFEQRFAEQRPFFTEGTEIFNKGNMFYSRRIGNKPINHYSEDDLNTGEALIENPDKVNMLNAIKVSGRTKKGLGVGIFNAITEKTEAKIRDSITNEVRSVTTEPFANYNVLVLDQQFNKNSSITFVNTNVLREGHVRDANATALLLNLVNKKNTHFIEGDAKMSTIHEDGDKTNGFFFDTSIGKSAGKWRYEIGYRMSNENYDINDLGIQNRNNYQRVSADARFRIFEPTKIFRRFNFFTWANLRYRHSDGAYTGNHMGMDFNVTTLNQLTFRFNLNGNIGTQYDYYEPRVDNRYYAHAPRQNYRIGFRSDSSKKLELRVNLRAGTRKPEDNSYVNMQIAPRFRFNDKFIINYAYDIENRKNEKGYVDELDDGTIIFGNRERKNIVNAMTGQYSFNVKSSLALTFRHYWSPITYDSQFYQLEDNGTLSVHSYNENNDINYNIWNLDVSYTWQLAPGSQLIALYRNAISNEDDQSYLGFNDNLSNLFNQPKQQNFSLKLIYYIDYNDAKNWLK